MNHLTARTVRITASWDDGYSDVSIVPAPQAAPPSEGAQVDPDFVGTRLLRSVGARAAGPRLAGDGGVRADVLLVAPVCIPCLPDRGAARAVGMGYSGKAGLCDIVPVCADHDDIPPRVSMQRLEALVGMTVRWDDVASSFVTELVALSDQVRGVTAEPLSPGGYVHELWRNAGGHLRPGHLRVGVDGRVWAAPWSELVDGVPAVDVAVRRTGEGLLELEFPDLQMAMSLRRLTDDDVQRGFTIPIDRVTSRTAVIDQAERLESRD